MHGQQIGMIGIKDLRGMQDQIAEKKQTKESEQQVRPETAQHENILPPGDQATPLKDSMPAAAA
jgi:hypothetical protein